MKAVTWEQFAANDPALAAHVEERLRYAPCYFSTVRPNGWPRVHPVGVAPRGGSLVVPMYPTSPKGHDLGRNGMYALHAAVEDNSGGGGEVMITGTARPAEPSEEDASKGWILFELLIGEVLSTRYDAATSAPVVVRWRAPSGS